MLKKSGKGLVGSGGADQGSEENETSRGLWEKLNLAVVSSNATQWFEQFAPQNVADLVGARDYTMHHWSPFVSGALEDHIIPSMRIETGDLGDEARIEETSLGKAVMEAMDSLGATYSFAPPVPPTLLEQYPIFKELLSTWGTDEEVAFTQHLRVYRNNGVETAFWFVKLLVGSNSMAKQIESSDEEGNRWLITEGQPSYGDVSSDIHLPIFLKNLAWFCETPFPSTPIMQMSRDVAFGDIPEQARPRPRFAIAENDLVWSHATSESTPDNVVTQSDIMPEAVWFGWTFTEDSIDHLNEILPIVTSGCSLAVSTLENGYTHFRNEDYAADYDSVLANPCIHISEYVRGESRLGGAYWFPSTEIGDILANSGQIYLDVRDRPHGDEEALDVLFSLANQGVGTVQNAAINTAAYLHLLPDISIEGPGQKADLAERYLALASSAGNTSEAWNAKNNLAALKILVGEFQEAIELLDEVLGSEWEDYHAEALAYMSLAKHKVGDLQAAKECADKCDQIGGFELPSWVNGEVAKEPGSSSRPAFCSNCGSKFDGDEANFCQSCGNRRG